MKDWLTSRCQNAAICGKIPRATGKDISQRELFPDWMYIRVLIDHTSKIQNLCRQRLVSYENSKANQKLL